MPNDLDVLKLIEEVKARPVLYDSKYADLKDRSVPNQLWQEVSEILGVDVEQCRRKWKNLRDAYRAEIRRTNRRVERLRATGDYDKSINLQSKWIYFAPLCFLEDCGRRKYMQMLAAKSEGEAEGDCSNHSNNSMEVVDPLHDQDFENLCDVKMEPNHGTVAGDDNDDEDDKLFAEFQSVATPQAARRLSNSISMANGPENEVIDVDAFTEPRCKCMRPDDQVHFLENLEREEQKLMQSTRQDISRDNSGHNFGDSDYNFLMSFLPQMKRMCELQNLQFRVKMSELLLNIMTAQATTTALVPTAPIAEQQGSVMQCMQQQPQTHKGQLIQRQPTMSALAGGAGMMASERLGSTVSSTNNALGTTSSSSNNNIWN